MSDGNALVPVQQKEVEFYEDRITAVYAQDDDRGDIYVSINQICDLLGIDRRGQQRRITNDAVLAKHTRQVVIQTAGGPQTVLCLPVDYMHGWLMSINANRVKADIQERLIRYQEQCHRVLAEAFREGRLTADPGIEELLQTSDSPSAQAYRTLRAMVRLARQQVVMEAELEAHAGRLAAAEVQLSDHAERLEDIEANLGDSTRFVTAEQASQISQAVKAIALELGKQTNRNEFGAVYGELYRKFGVTSYKEIPAVRFREAMDFLTEWYATVTGSDELPF